MDVKIKSLIVGTVVALAGFTVYVPSAEAGGDHYKQTTYTKKEYKTDRYKHHYKNREKKKEPKPVYSCDSLTASQLSHDTYRFTAAGTGENGAVITGWEYDFGDGTKEHGDAATTSMKHTYDEPGTYIATAMVEVGVDGTFYGSRSEACRVTVTVEDETCPVPGKEQLSKNDADCKEAPVATKVKACDTKTGQVVKIEKEHLQSDRYTTDWEDCQKPPVAHTASVKPTATPPATKSPDKLPETGVADIALSSLGVGSLVAAGYHYIASRRMVSKLEK